MKYIEKLNLQTDEIEEVETLEKHTIINNEPISVNKYNGHTRDFLALDGDFNDGFKQLKETNGLGINCIVSKRVNDLKSSLENIVTYDIEKYDCVGDGITDNKEKFKEIFNLIKEGEVLYIPKGEFKIVLTDDDLTAGNSPTKNMYYYLIKENIDNIKIYGQGKLIIDASQCTLKPALIKFYNCNNVTIDGIKIIGDVEFGENKVIYDKHINGIVFDHCSGTNFTNNVMENIMVCLLLTSNSVSPSSGLGISKDNKVIGNIFKNYGQVTTFGSGTSRLIFSNNHCINALQCGFKISTNVLYNEEIIDTVKDNSTSIFINNNIIEWEADYKFSIPEWALTTSFSPCGIMIEGHTLNVKINNNIVNMSKIKQVLNNPIQEIGCIVLFKGNENIKLQNELVEIINNTLLTYKDKKSIVLTPFTYKLIIKDNVCKGHMDINTSTPSGEEYDLLLIDGNIFYSANNTYLLSLGNGTNYKKIDILNNVFSTECDEYTYNGIELSNVKSKTLTIKNNDMKKADVFSYTSSNIDVNVLNIENNLLRGITLYSKETTRQINIVRNNFECYKNCITLENKNDSIICDISFNTGYVESTFITVNKGKLYLNENTIDITQTGTPMTIGNCFVKAGTVIGQGAPTINAWCGVKYYDYSTVGENLYIKTNISENYGWKLI